MQVLMVHPLTGRVSLCWALFPGNCLTQGNVRVVCSLSLPMNTEMKTQREDREEKERKKERGRQIGK